jgi:uncharacterized membrane protein (UPF0127 family)
MLRTFKHVFYAIALLFALYLVLNMSTGISLKDAFKPSAAANFISGSLVIHTQKGDAHGFNVQVANTPSTRTQGLMDQKNLPQNQGMLLIFENTKILGLWMKNTYIPLDMIFINQSGVIIEIVSNTKPLSTHSIIAPESTFAVLEINAGLADKLNVTVGDKVVYKY